MARHSRAACLEQVGSMPKVSRTIQSSTRALDGLEGRYRQRWKRNLVGVFLKSCARMQGVLWRRGNKKNAIVVKSEVKRRLMHGCEESKLKHVCEPKERRLQVKCARDQLLLICGTLQSRKHKTAIRDTPNREAHQAMHVVRTRPIANRGRDGKTSTSMLHL